MPASLQQRVRRIAERAGRLIRLYGIGWFVAAMGLVVIIAGALDYVARFQDTGVRLIVSSLAWVVVSWSFYWFIHRSWRYRCSDLQAARHIEKRFPVLGDRLTSAVAFSRQSPREELAGSLQLRRAVIAETEAVVDQLDVEGCLDHRSPRRALAAAGAVGIVLVALLAIDGRSVQLAARRLVMPWAAASWPRRHALKFVSPPTRIAAGRDFEVVLIDANGPLPNHVRIHYWEDGDEATRIQTHAMQPLGKQLTHRRINVTHGFRFRATGGDDRDMPWLHVAVVEPPKIIEQELTLHPPAYTAAPPWTASGSFQVLQGTRVTVRVRVDRPVSRAEIVTDTTDDSPIRMILDKDRLGFSLPPNDPTVWIVVKSGTYGFRMVDANALDVNAVDRSDIQVIRDAPPTVILARPVVDLQVVAAASVPIEAIIEDDMAIHRVQLQYQYSDNSDDHPKPIDLWSGEDQLAAASVPGDNKTRDGVRRSLGYRWDLAQVDGLAAGRSLQFEIVATDYKPQQGRSVSRRLTIISMDMLIEQLGQRQSEILAQIAEIARMQRQTRSQTASLAIQLREVGTLARDDVDQLQSAELNQRQVQQRLAHPSDGIRAQLQHLLDQFRDNRVDAPEMRRRLRHLSDAVGRLNETTVPRIEHELLNAMKAARESLRIAQSSPDAKQLHTQLVRGIRDAGDYQGFVVDALERLLREFSQWDSYQRLARELGHLRRQQDESRTRTETLRLATLTRSLDDLTPQQRADLRRAAEHQNDLARQFDRLLSRMEQTRDKLRDSEPLASTTLAEALDVADQATVSGIMHDAGRQLQSNQLGQAIEQQEHASQWLGELQDILANRREQQLDKLAGKLEEAAKQLDQVRQQQEQVKQAIKAEDKLAPGRLKQLGQREARLAQQSRRLARRLDRLQARQAESALSQAAQQMNQAEQAGKQRQRQALRKHAEQASKQLEKARKHLQQTLKKTQQNLEKEQRAVLQRKLTELASGQRRILDQTRGVDRARIAAEGRLTPDQRTQIQTLATQQGELSVQVNQLRQKIERFLAFAFVLRDVADEMARAQTLLEKQNVGIEPQAAQQQSLDRIEQLRTALKMEPPPPTDPKNSNAKPKPPNNQAARPGDVSLLAQLKLVRMMQVEINDQTRQLDIARQADRWNQQLARRQRDLVQRQGELADILFELLQQAEQNDSAPPPMQLDE